MHLEGKQILLVGCGDVGCQLAKQLIEKGASAYGLRRNIAALPAGVRGIAADITDSNSLGQLADFRFDYVVVTTTAGEFSDARYRAVYVDGLQNVLTALGDRPQRLLLASSTSVYGQSQGEWVNEDSPTQPQGFAGQRQLQAEQIALQSGIATTVVRFAGIYGPGRSRLIAKVARGESVPTSPVIFTNRIHRDDCAAVLAFLLEADSRGEPLQSCYLAVDCEPVPLREVYEWLAGQLGVAPQSLSEQAKAARRGSKRCSNQRLLDLGFEFQMKSYRDGYPSLVSDYRQSTQP